MIVDFHVPASFLHHTAVELPEASARIRQLHCASDGCRTVVAFGSVDRGSLEAALAADESVGGMAHVSTTRPGHLYSLDTQDHVVTTMGRGLVGGNSVFEGARRQDDSWAVRAQFPNKGTVLAFRDELADSGVDVDIQSFTEDAEVPTQYGVTDPQREVLLLALDEGYFTVPREASLSDLADDLGISSQAASERLRRGTRSLLENTLANGEGRLVESPLR
jgi:predicted DNA binding protein